MSDEERLARRQGPTGPEPYQPHEINSYGDVSRIKPGWISVPRRQAIAAPVKHTILVGWSPSRSRNYPSRPIKEAVVPIAWWTTQERRLAENDVRRREAAVARQLGITTRAYRQRLRQSGGGSAREMLERDEQELEERRRASEAESRRRRAEEARLAMVARQAEAARRTAALATRLAEIRRSIALDWSTRPHAVDDSTVHTVVTASALIEANLRSRKAANWRVTPSRSGATIFIAGDSVGDLCVLLGVDPVHVTSDSTWNGMLGLRLPADPVTLAEYVARSAGLRSTTLGAAPIVRTPAPPEAWL